MNRKRLTSTDQTKYKQSKTEASNAQNSLQKEITSLRETSRNQQLKLRDIEVANDDFERQARNTTSSLEDLESKYNQTLERSVILEEEIKGGDQEREGLRIETQRLRDELSDLKIEADITQEKLRSVETMIGRRPKRTSQVSDSNLQVVHSPASEGSLTSASLNSTFTPPRPKSEISATTSEAITPPSPPLSISSAQNKTTESPAMSLPKKTPSVPMDDSKMLRPSSNATPKPTHVRGDSKGGHGSHPPPTFQRPTVRRVPRNNMPKNELPRSESLYQIRGLIGKMQKLEQRVQSARSKLPAPANTPPRSSPRGSTPTAHANISSNVTVRSAKKRSSASTTISSQPADEAMKRLSHRQSKVCFGGPPAEPASSRPNSRASNVSQSGFARPSSRADANCVRSKPDPYRPGSAADARRPRSSMSGSYTPSQGHRQSMSQTMAEEDGEHGFATPTPRRTTLDKSGLSAIPAPTSLTRRQSIQTLKSTTPARRKSMKTLAQAQRTPLDAGGATRRLHDRREEHAELGETF